MAKRLPDRFIIEIKDGFAITPGNHCLLTDRPSIILPDEDVRCLIRAALEIDEEEDWDGDSHCSSSASPRPERASVEPRARPWPRFCPI